MKILVVNTVSFRQHGLISVIYNYCANMDRTDLDFVFTAINEVPEELKAKFEPLGRIVQLPSRREGVKNYLWALGKLIREEKIDVIHIHGNSGTMLAEVLLSKLCGVKNIIIHAHSTQTTYPLINRLLKVPMMHLSDTCIACSKATGEWLYGQHPYTVLNNAIDLPRFCFSERSRDKYRKEFGIQTELVIGHVGHFSHSKNHDFLIDVFYELHKSEPNSKLLLLGDGALFNEIKDKTKCLGLQEAVIFAGRRNDTADIYSAMDIFILPSNWEGLPLVTVEAQANSLPALVSKAVPLYAKGSDYLFYKDLSDGAGSWAQALQVIMERKMSRNSDTHQGLTDIGLNIQTEAEKLRMIYLGEKCGM